MKTHLTRYPHFLHGGDCGNYTDLETGERLQDTVPVVGYGIRILRKEN